MRSGPEDISSGPVYLQLFFHHSINLSIAENMNTFAINNPPTHVARKLRHLYPFCCLLILSLTRLDGP